MINPYLQKLIQSFSPQALFRFLNDKNPKIEPVHILLPSLDADNFIGGEKVGEVPLSAHENLAVYSIQVNKALSERSGKKMQYDLAKKLLKDANDDAGIFVFYDAKGDFRFSLVYANYLGKKRDWSNFRRFTYFVSPKLTNKTFLDRIGNGDFSSLKGIQDAFSVEKVTKEFYEQISYWYFWACKECRFPEDAEKEENGREISVIRLITRLIFVWFMREKALVRPELFDKRQVSAWLKELEPQSSSYYLAILQNLFFATLNTPQKDRQFRSEIRGPKGHNPDFGNEYVYRHQALFAHPELLQEYFRDIPFLNGGLFDCLDERDKAIYIDGFSDTKKNQPVVPNQLFFSDEINVDLNAEYGTSNKTYKVKGLLEILSSYNFTIDENTADDKDVALDPELLGRVFENLLASFNPETSTTARKATGSYYTPREIVDYMVDESLKAYLREHLVDIPNVEERITWLFSQEQDNNPFSARETKRIVRLIEGVRIVDPAVGSGAFPMGALNKMVFLLTKLDPDNHLWQQAQLDSVENIPDYQARAAAQAGIRKYFEEKNLDYGRKVFLIEKCIYGVDIQQIAVEIAKLRFFISLLVEETVEKEKKNWGIEPLPNLDFKIMQGNSLISVFEGIDFDPKQALQPQEGLFAAEDEKLQLVKQYESKKASYQSASDHHKKHALRIEIDQLLIKIFKQITLSQKADYAAKMAEIDRKFSVIEDPKLRVKLSSIEKQRYANATGFDMGKIERRLSEYSKKHLKRDFFPWGLYFSEVFSEKGGFDIVLGNPPYIQLQKDGGLLADLYSNQAYETFNRMGDIYCLFYELGHRLLRQGGHLCFITSNKWMRAGYGVQLRRFFAEKTNPVLLIDFAGKKLFESVTVDNNILLYQKSPNAKACRTLAVSEGFDHRSGLAEYLEANLVVKSNFVSADTWVISSGIEEEIRRKIEAKGTPLGEWDVKIYRGVLTGYNNAFIVDGATKDRLIREDPKSAEILKPILRGRDIKRYQAEFTDLWLIYVPWHFPLHEDPTIQGASRKAEDAFRNQYPAIYQHLLKHKDKLSNRNKAETGKIYEWYALQRAAATYYEEFEKEKIMYSEIVREQQFFFDNSGFYPEATTFIITGSSLKYLIALLNSDFVTWAFKKFYAGGGLGKEGFRYKKQFLNLLPLIQIDASDQKPFTKLVDQIIKSTNTNNFVVEDEKTITIGVQEAQINHWVYKLYGLTDMERDYVESGK